MEGVWRSPVVRNKAIHPVTGNNVVNKLQMLLFKQIIVIDKRVKLTLINEFANGSYLFLDVRMHAQPVL